MTEPLYFAADLPGELLVNESMAKHVSWRAGGPAKRAYLPQGLQDLGDFLRALPANEPICFVGLGSNLLVRDGGFEGSVVLMHDTQAHIAFEHGLIYAEAGAASPKVARFTALEGYEGAEFLAGIPGSIGGALAMNAGCYGSETWNHVARVQTIRRDGTVLERLPGDFDIAYRHVQLKGGDKIGEDEWFVGAYFRFPRGNAEQARARIKTLLDQRAATQPLNLPNAGSVFRNPPGDHAARLIEACGLKGYGIGGARISEKHANFIVNPRGQAKAADIEALIAHARSTVQERLGITLVPEVRIVGKELQA
ncbi:MAG TPA: UDP-N-acetylmuramate dehydrogenase [Burkholderiales bacterium]|nr:UDP-N-acetylmuramate dehydrogenase [Burkholderiales bacterium]